MKKLLILGSSGLVGGALVEELKYDYDVYGTYHSQNRNLPRGKAFCFDVKNTSNISQILKETNPQIVISCLRGEFEEQMNAHKQVANYLSACNGKLYFCSTANVFDGDVTKPHYEDEKPNANSEYGKYKEECETSLKEILGDNLIILRLPMLWGKSSPRFSELVNNLKNENEIEAYSNLYKNSNTDVMLAKQIHYIIDNELKGVFHLGSMDIVKHIDFINKLIDRLGYKDPKIMINTLPQKEYYLGVLSKREELPTSLQITNDDVIEFLAK